MHATGTATAFAVCVCEWWRKYEKAIYDSVHPRSTLVVAARGRTHDTRAQTLSLAVPPPHPPITNNNTPYYISALVYCSRICV